MKYSQYFSDNDISKFETNKFAHIMMAKTEPTESKLHDILASDLKGWYMTQNNAFGNKIDVFHSPTGHKIVGRRMLLKHMIENNFSEHQITGAKELLKEDGWNSDERLPLNWLYKRRVQKGVAFISSSGN